MYIYVIEALINVHYETKDEELKNLIIRMADFLKDRFLYGGDYDESGNYKPLQSQYLWVENENGEKLGEGGEIIKDVFWSDLFAYAYQLTNNSQYLEWARKTFRDAMFYYACYGRKYLNPDIRAKISYVDNKFPTSHTKIHGWIGRTNQVYLYTEWQLKQGELKIITTSLPDGIKDKYYSYPISSADGTPPYTWEIISGALPTGLTLSNDGKISGIPNKAGTFNFTIQLTDSHHNTATQSFSLVIQPGQPPTLIGDLNQDHKVNALDFQILIQKFKQTQDIDTQDLNQDGIVDIKDLGLLMHYWEE